MNKSHNEFLKDIERESTIPAQIEKTLSPESKEDYVLLGVNE